jgi:hypothetical protein
MVTTESYLWESEPDHSKENAIRFLKPCEKIFNGTKMQHSEKEGVFYDPFSNMVCFDTSVYHNSQQYLSIKKNNLIEHLNDNNLEMIWTIIGEKQIIGGDRRSSNDDFRGYFEYSGAYYLDKKKVQGKIQENNRNKFSFSFFRKLSSLIIPVKTRKKKKKNNVKYY